jgi:Rieske 2Fe-2S family protein
MVCREEELTGVGSYVEHVIHTTSLIVVRESSTSIRAYHNACRHRGTRLATGRGRIGSFICPFHGWRWNLDGSTRLVLDEEEFCPRTAEDLDLQEVRCETWGGFVFINMDTNAQPLLEYLDPIPTVFEPFQFEHMRIKWWKGTVVPCNWKTILDGFLEAYHVPGTHPQLHRWDKTNTNIISIRELENRIWSPTAVWERHARYASQSQRFQRVEALGEEVDPEQTRERMPDSPSDDPRLKLAHAVETMHGALRALHPNYELRAAQAIKTADIPEGKTARQVFGELSRTFAEEEGLEWRDITPDQFATAGTAWNVFPNTILLPNRGNIIGYRARPYGLDPDQSIYEAFCLEQIPVADYYKKRPDFTPEFHEDWQDPAADWGQILTQDIANADDVTIGMHSPSFDGHRLSTKQEMTIWNHHRVADRYLWT